MYKSKVFDSKTNSASPKKKKEINNLNPKKKKLCKSRKKQIILGLRGEEYEHSIAKDINPC